MAIGPAILRGTKIAAYLFAGVLLSIVVYNITSIPPVPPPEVFPDFDAAADPSSMQQLTPTVPPPPPLPRPAIAFPRNPLPRAAAPAQGIQIAGLPLKIEETDRAEVIGPALESRTFGELKPAEQDSEVVAQEPPPAIVIVRPLERERHENRALRWLKLLGDGFKDE